MQTERLSGGEKPTNDQTIVYEVVGSELLVQYLRAVERTGDVNIRILAKPGE